MKPELQGETLSQKPKNKLVKIKKELLRPGQGRVPALIVFKFPQILFHLHLEDPMV